MADTPNLPTVDVIGAPWDPFRELDLQFPGYFNTPEYAQPVDAGQGGGDAPPEPAAPQETFAPPIPEVLPEVIVQPKPTPTPPPPVRVPVPPAPLLPLLGLILPTVTGSGADLPSDFRIVDNQFKPPPAPPKPPPPAEPPDQPDYLEGLGPWRPPGERYASPLEDLLRIRWDWVYKLVDSLLQFPKPPTLTPPRWMPDALIELPQVLLPEFEVNPPARTTRSPLPTPGIYEVPFVQPDWGLDFALDPDFGIGPPLPDVSAPGSDPLELPTPGRTADPFRRALPRPEIDPAPDVVGSPFEFPGPDPSGNPDPGPKFDELPRPSTPKPGSPQPFSPGVPDLVGDRFATPFEDTLTYRDPLAGLDPLAQPQPMRAPADPCKCTKVGDKKERKKRQPRTVCYRGTYRQLSKGISYKRLEEVPCEAKAPKEPKAKPATKKPRKKKLKPGQFPLEVFNSPF